MSFLINVREYRRDNQNGQSRETGNIGYIRLRKTMQRQNGQSRETGNIGYIRLRKTMQRQNGQSRETGSIPMLPVSLDCSFCLCIVFLSLMYPMLPVSLDCPFYFCIVFLSLMYPRQNEQSRETGNIGYIRLRKTIQK
jgi:hypothetical protein